LSDAKAYSLLTAYWSEIHYIIVIIKLTGMILKGFAKSEQPGYLREYTLVVPIKSPMCVHDPGCPRVLDHGGCAFLHAL
jgi:hypothetical protein